MASFRSPTKEEKDKIEKWLINSDKVNFEDIGVVDQWMANNKRTAYNSALTKPILENFEKQLNDGMDRQPVPLNMNHASPRDMWTLGNAFNGEIRNGEGTNEFGDPVLDLFGQFYTIDGLEIIPIGGGGFFGDINTVPMTTEDLAKKYNAGMVRGGSIGFDSKKAYCSECNEMYGSDKCNHVFGKEYNGRVATLMWGVSSPDDKTSDGFLNEYSWCHKPAIKGMGAIKRFNYDYTNKIYTASMTFHIGDTQRFIGTKCAKTKNVVEPSSTEGEKKMEISEKDFMDLTKKSIGFDHLQDKFDELTEKLVKLEGIKQDFQSLSVDNERLQKEFDELKTNNVGLEKSFSDHKSAIIEEVKKSHVQAFNEEPNTEELNKLEFGKLFESFENNIKKFYSEIEPGSSFQSSKTDDGLARVNAIAAQKLKNEGRR